MGYGITYEGSFRIAPALTAERRDYLLAFSRTWRRPRDVERLVANDTARIAVGLAVGPEGAFYVGGAAHDATDDDDATVVSFARGPGGQPGVRCCWRVASAGDSLAWDGCEKFADAAEWLRYLVATFFSPWGYTVDGSVRWQGEDDAVGTIVVVANAVDEGMEEEAGVDDEVRSWIATLRTGSPEMRVVAAEQLGSAQHASAASMAAAIRALADALDEPAVAVKALETLGGFGEVASSAVERVVPRLESPSPMVRYWATFALARMGPRARVALPILERLRNDREDGPRYGAIDAIARLTR